MEIFNGMLCEGKRVISWLTFFIYVSYHFSIIFRFNRIWVVILNFNDMLRFDEWEVKAGVFYQKKIYTYIYIYIYIYI
jgi:hypothetical protein